MLAISNDNGGFYLTYLGFASSGFSTMAEAQGAGQEFARGVLAHMASLITD